MRKLFTGTGLVALNLVLFALAGAAPANAAVDGWKHNCCKQNTGGAGYCCDDCCWFGSDQCTGSGQCPDIIPT